MVDVRSRRTKRLNRARVELELSRAMRPAVWVAAGLALGIALAGFILLRTTPDTLKDTYEARFAVSDATGVQPGLNDVKIKGVPVGTITDVRVEGDRPVLHLRVQSEHGRIFRDARAQLRPNTALQDMYLDILDRGTPAAGELGEDDVLAASRTDSAVNLSDVLNVFAPSQRLRLRTLLDELGNGLEDRGRSLRALFVQLVPFVQQAGDISRQLAGRRPQVRRLVRNMAVLTRELGRREDALRTLVREGGTTLRTLQEGSGDLDATLRELPPVLTAVDSGFAATRAVLGDVDTALRTLRPVASELPASLDAVRDLSDDLRPAVRELQRPVARLTPLARALRPLSTDLDEAVSALGPQADTVDKVVKDLAVCKQGIQGFFQWNASMSKFGDARGPVPRGNVVLGAQSSAILNDPFEYAPQACTPGRVIGGRVPTSKDER